MFTHVICAEQKKGYTGKLIMSNTIDLMLHICGDKDAKDEAFEMLLHYITLIEKETTVQIIKQIL